MHFAASILIALLALQSGQKPEWCRDLPRPAYSKLEHVNAPDKWFEVYRIRPGIFAIYEPHQQEEVISYLIVGTKQALLFDTGMGISNIKKVVEGLTQLPVSVINSHTHNDHVSDNWRFNRIYGMDTCFYPRTCQRHRGRRAGRDCSGINLRRIASRIRCQIICGEAIPYHRLDSWRRED